MYTGNTKEDRRCACYGSFRYSLYPEIVATLPPFGIV